VRALILEGVTGLFVREGAQFGCSFIWRLLGEKAHTPIVFVSNFGSLGSGRALIPFHHDVFRLENGSVWSVIVRLASGRFVPKICSWRVGAHSIMCFSVFGVQRSICQKEEKDTPRWWVQYILCRTYADSTYVVRM